ncbi:MAG: hypothetical protein C0602_02385 [Denitrovibrio sp.]|nr:MAG: hypothetical protein C0602_02385 [Denitrovibrio sp.]
MALRCTRLLVLLLTGLTLAACVSSGSNLDKAKIDESLNIPESFEEPGSETYAGRWWEAFGSQELNALIESMIGNNYQIAGSYERLKALQAALGITNADRFPSVSASAKASDNNSEDIRGDRAWREGYEISVSASYEVDLWGRIKAGIDSDRYEILSGRYDLETLYMSLTSELTDRYFLYKTLASSLKLQKEQLELREKQITALKMMYSSGVGALDSIYLKQTATANLMESMTETRQSMQSAKRQIAMLIGESDPNRLDISDAYDIKIPALPSVIPSEIAEKRPDIRSAYAEVLKTDRDKAQAMANRYPKLSFSASAGYSGNAIQSLMTPENFVANLVGNLVMPLFDGDKRKLQVESQKYLLASKIYSYYQTVLGALNEVGASLSDNVQNEQALRLSSEKVKIEEKRLKIAEMKYEMGIKDYSEVIENKISLLSGWMAEINARRLLISSRVELVRAAGGGWAGEIVDERFTRTTASQENN